MNEYCKCNFCCNSAWDACDFCSEYDGYIPSQEKLIEKSKSENISVNDVIALIEYCGE